MRTVLIGLLCIVGFDLLLVVTLTVRWLWVDWRERRGCMALDREFAKMVGSR